jgi:hypothetical protein
MAYAVEYSVHFANAVGNRRSFLLALSTAADMLPASHKAAQQENYEKKEKKS